VTLDKLTYSGTRTSLRAVDGAEGHRFVQGDIADQALVSALLRDERVEAVVHLAAESHVDRSIDDPAPFVDTNVLGTFRLLETVRHYWRALDGRAREDFRFHHVSTDEVYGDLPFDAGRFTEDTPYDPSSPYSASKAAADHLVQAWHRTFGLPVLMSNCSNNYGPYHFPEKLIPLTILNAIEGRPLPVYGQGANVRDWLFVEDHAEALELIVSRAAPGSRYNVGGAAERTNLQVVEAICDLVDERIPDREGSRRRLIAFVADRPGHDRRYAIDGSKLERELDWTPRRGFEEGLAATVDWFLANEWWWRPLREGGASERRGLG
jgi:dTDP-glucose 4,6-dehydratase